MHQQHVIIYDKQKDKPQLTFTTVAFIPTIYPTDPPSGTRKQQELQKISAVVDYYDTPRPLPYFVAA
jgi:hypothetical protein